MRRLIVALALLAAACGGSAVTTPDPTDGTVSADTTASTTTSSTAGTSSDSGTTDPTPAATEAPQRERPEGRDAPDFTLALGQGGSFSLSTEQKPVYMVFWAEW